MKVSCQDKSLSDVPVVMQTAETKPEKNTTMWKLCTAAFIGVLLVIIVGLAVVIGLKQGSNPDNNEIKEYHATFHTNNQVIVEKAYVSDREEMFIADNVTAVYDHKTGFVVYKLHQQQSSKKEVCLMSSFNTSAKMSPAEFIKSHPESEIDLTLNTQYETLVPTNIRVNNAVLGPMSQGLCAGNNVYVLGHQGGYDADRAKRAEDGPIIIIICCFCICGIIMF